MSKIYHRLQQHVHEQWVVLLIVNLLLEGMEFVAFQIKFQQTTCRANETYLGIVLETLELVWGCPSSQTHALHLQLSRRRHVDPFGGPKKYHVNLLRSPWEGHGSHVAEGQHATPSNVIWLFGGGSIRIKD